MTLVFVIIILAMIFAAIYLPVRAFMQRGAAEAARRELGVDGGPRQIDSPVLRMARPFYLLLMPLAKGMKAERWREKKSRQIVAAGLDEQVNPDELLAFKFFLPVFVCLMLFPFRLWDDWWAWPAAILFGFFFPDMWLGEVQKARAREITRALPHVVDLLALSVEGGLDFMAALQRVVGRSEPNALLDELSLMIKQVQMGSTRQDGLRRLAWRCNIADLSSFVSVLVQADRLGVPIGLVLRSQADKMRTQRFQEAEKQGAAAAQKILLPLIICIMPAVFIVIVGPLIVQFLFGGGMGF